MVVLQADSLRLSFADRTILKDVNIKIPRGGRIALSGANGSGKTTLMKILAGIMESEGGSVQTWGRCSYLPQSGIEHRGCSLAEELETAFDHFRQDEAKLEQLGAELSSSREDDPDTFRLLEEHHRISEYLLQSHYYQRDQLIGQVVLGLGFEMDDLHRYCEEFSGGWQMRIALAKIILEQPDVMLLDEPTNYLDLEARQWLAGQLQRYSGGVLMVSHDRGFLDDTVDHVAELFLGELKLYRGNYSSYEAARTRELELLVKQYEQQQQEISQLEEFIQRFRANASKAAMVQSRIKQLEKIQVIELPESLKRMHISFPPAPRSGDMVLEARDISKSYADLHIYRDIELELRRGDKAVILGPNGAGKSTLLRILAGRDLDFTGNLRLGSKVQPAYFAQDAEDELNLDLTVIEELENSAPTHLLPQVRSMLGAFLFRGDDIFKPVSVLSGGEKNRLALVKLLLRPANLLILDEPTNHLDLASKEVLLDALKSFEGTVVFVSHDAFFIRSLATRVIELSLPGGGRSSGNGRAGWRQLMNIPGDYDYYLDYRSRHPLSDEPKLSGGSSRNSAGSAGPDPVNNAASGVPGTSSSASSGDHQEQKRRRSELAKLKRDEEELMTRIMELEEELGGIHEKMGSEEYYSDGKKIRELNASLAAGEAELEKLQQEWDAVDRKLKEMEAQA